jgi:cobalt/nickel transport system permease protein
VELCSGQIGRAVFPLAGNPDGFTTRRAVEEAHPADSNLASCLRGPSLLSLAKKQTPANTPRVHIPDGFLDLKTCAGTFCVAGAGLAYALRQTNARWTDKTVPLMGVMSAFVFAGQMVNFPIAGGTSGHLQGGVLAAIFLGPYGAALVMTTVLFVQCFLFQDGGVTALGANLLNMSLVGVMIGYGVFRLMHQWFQGPRGTLAGAAVGSWVAVVASSIACSLELAGAQIVPLRAVLPAMTITHAVIGLGEALITVGVVSFVLKVRPDLLYDPRPALAERTTLDRPLKPYLVQGLLLAVGVALLISPFASSLPDGLEFLAARFHFQDQARAIGLPPLADYAFPGVTFSWLATSLAAGIGTLVTFASAWGIGRWLRRPRSASNVD